MGWDGSGWLCGLFLPLLQIFILVAQRLILGLQTIERRPESILLGLLSAKLLFQSPGGRLRPLLRGLRLGKGRLMTVISGRDHRRPAATPHLRQPGFRLLLPGTNPRDFLFRTLQGLQQTVTFRRYFF
ncbi:hypothetical protein CfE428DRAFT_3373 [Chthoniobacter flavus Ellin428]|uniref:Uncharacterized protein n=1 Tax=Chthoniobacter flavus Ellin428 TaxID=497964 RepID=B4D385_9BACT|nr:hypothetical protein CfE428DRAFT_3373 [Chthoniobacter flavus Ellin428]